MTREQYDNFKYELCLQEYLENFTESKLKLRHSVLHTKEFAHILLEVENKIKGLLLEEINNSKARQQSI